MKSKYLLTFQNNKGSITYEFDNGLLCHLQVSDDMELTEKQRLFVLKRTPLAEIKIKDNLTHEGFILQAVPADLSFAHFWKEYNNFASKKKYTQSLWEQRTDAEKVMMLDYLPKYKSIKKTEGTQMVYASTYITQENWK